MVLFIKRGEKAVFTDGDIINPWDKIFYNFRSYFLQVGKGRHPQLPSSTRTPFLSCCLPPPRTLHLDNGSSQCHAHECKYLRIVQGCFERMQEYRKTILPILYIYVCKKIFSYMQSYSKIEKKANNRYFFKMY